MKSENFIEVLGVVLDFLSNKRLIQLIRRGDMDEVADLLSKSEKILHDYGVLSGERRAALLGILVLTDLHKLDDADVLFRRIENEKIILNDIIEYHRLVSRGDVEVGAFRITNGIGLKDEYVKNLRTGIRQSQSKKGSKAPYRAIKPYLANNHLAGRLLRSPEFLMNDLLERLVVLKTKFGYEIDGAIDLIVTLENMPYQGKKIDDIYVLMQLPNLRLNINGKPLDLSDVMEFVRLTGDSKFYYYPTNIRYDKVLFQQSVLTIGDRMEQLWEVYMKAKNAGLTIDEMENVITALIPFMIQHYVIIPPDRPIASGVRADYASFIAEDFDSHFLAFAEDNASEITQAAKEMIMDVGNQHIDDHFGQGKFILTHELTYADLPKGE